MLLVPPSELVASVLLLPPSELVASVLLMPPLELLAALTLSEFRARWMILRPLLLSRILSL